MTSTEPTVVLARPKLLILGCAADAVHLDEDLRVQHSLGDSPVRGIDYLEFSSPGVYPNDGSLDLLRDLALRFSVPRVLVITHTDCGVILAMRSFLEDRKTDVLFGQAAEKIITELEESGISKTDLLSKTSGELAMSLSLLIASRVAQKFTEPLSNCEISAKASVGIDGELVEVLPFTAAHDIH